MDAITNRSCSYCKSVLPLADFYPSAIARGDHCCKGCWKTTTKAARRLAAMSRAERTLSHLRETAPALAPSLSPDDIDACINGPRWHGCSLRSGRPAKPDVLMLTPWQLDRDAETIDDLVCLTRSEVVMHRRRPLQMRLGGFVAASLWRASIDVGVHAMDTECVHDTDDPVASQ